ncbi:MAG TPA: tetratricopeptide repeat protein [Polyangia bacterium]|nr:tetratricopeptide repeat protein [Polyangia bacterium]
MTAPALALALAAVLAGRAGPAPEQVARRHFDRAEKLYALEKFQDALTEYEAAYDAKPLPGFLFNIGQCYRNLGNFRQAVFSYKRYLSLRPDTRNRAEIEDLIVDLEKKIADADRRAKNRALRLEAQTPPPQSNVTPVNPVDPPPPTPAETPFYGRWWFWTAIAVVAAGALVGVYAASSGNDNGVPPTTLPPIDFPR